MVRRVLWADLSIWACIFSILVHRCIHTALASWAATFKQAPMIAVDVDKIRSSTFVLGGLSDWSLNSLSSIRAKVGELGASVMYFNAISVTLLLFGATMGDVRLLMDMNGYEWIIYKDYEVLWRCMRFMCIAVRIFIHLEWGGQSSYRFFTACDMCWILQSIYCTTSIYTYLYL